ncbi:kinetochore Sim4 complex subunit FTA2-domain-containing protein [Hypoxylon argillaceum]|nr:kinetochore Sim4 complex subunit FTA2-domain-containing protein [Hypoxylon argillaceum]
MCLMPRISGSYRRDPILSKSNHLLADDLVRYHLDPFYAECRAFGLLSDKKKDDALAVRCHGYTFLPQTVEHQIQKQFGLDNWNRQPEDEGHLLRAIVKDYIPFKSVCGRKTLSAMRSNLKQLNDMGIFNMDIREDNYRGGRLFDFSIAVTSPHISLWIKLRPKKQIFEDCRYDMGCFSEMAETIEEQRKLTRARWLEGTLRRRSQSKQHAGISKRR